MSINIVTTDQFAELRQNFGYYVDKTSFVVDFLQDPTDASRFRVPASATLFTRPRRFGKTLFMNMLAEFFDIKKQGDGQNLFEGLAVSANEKLCQEWMHQYPVISITLKDVNSSTFADALERIQDLVSEICSENDELLNSSSLKAKDRNQLKLLHSMEADRVTLSNALFILTKVMYRHYGKPAILLIDEYDVPVAKAAEKEYAAENEYYDEMILFMRNFLSRALKTNRYLKFAILTGALRITKESIFTGLNNLRCYDITTSTYADLFGFTQNEVDRLLHAADLADKREEIRDWYDGYRFGKRQEIYCPWSIMQYLDDLQKDPEEEPKAYWVNTSSNDLPKDFVRRLPQKEDVPGKVASLIGGVPIKVRLNPAMNYVDRLKSADNFWSLLYLTGYLTRVKDEALYPGTKSAKDCILVIPNREVREVFHGEIEGWLADILPENGREVLYRALWDQDVQKFEEQLTALLAKTSFHDAKEAYYHGMMFGILAIRYGDTISNGESGRGLYDIVIQDKENSRAAVLEFKLASSAEQLEACVHNALKQIAEQDYDARLRAKGWKTILHAGISFCQKSAKAGFKQVSV